MNKRRIDPESVPAIAHRLKLLRQALSSSQAEFCAQMGFNRTTWNTYETARGRISVDFAMALWKRHSVPLDWIYLGVPAQLPSHLSAKIQELEESGGRERA